MPRPNKYTHPKLNPGEDQVLRCPKGENFRLWRQAIASWKTLQKERGEGVYRMVTLYEIGVWIYRES